MLGLIGNAVLLLAALAALALAGVLRGTPPRRVGMLVATLGLAATVVVVLRIVIRPEEIDGYEFEATLKAGVFVTLIGAILVTGSGLVADGYVRASPQRSGGR